MLSVIVKGIKHARTHEKIVRRFAPRHLKRREETVPSGPCVVLGRHEDACMDAISQMRELLFDIESILSGSDL